MWTLQAASKVRTVEHGDVRASSSENPAGRRETLAVSPRSTRWMPQAKAKLLDDLRAGFISLEDACERHDLSIEECATWQQGMKRFGLAGLQVTKVQMHRRRLNTHSSDC